MNPIAKLNRIVVIVITDISIKLKKTTNNSRKVVKNVLEKHIYKHNQDLKIIGFGNERIIESVLSEPEVINNITEIRNLSTDMYTHCINVFIIYNYGVKT